MLDTLQQFYEEKEEPYKSCFWALRDIILKMDAYLSETIKYSMPCFTYRKKACCYLWMDKKSHEPYILMVEGKFLKHPALESGDRARMKILRVNPHLDLPIKTIQDILNEALNLYRDGIVKAK